MKILMTTDTVGGVWSYALELSRALAEYDVQVALATMGRAPLEQQRREVRQLPNVRLLESHYKLEWQADPWDDLAAAGQWLMELQDQLEPDVIHLNGYAHGALPWRAPVLIVAHSCVLSWWCAVKQEPAPEQWNRYERAVAAGLRAADAVAAPSHAMLDAVQRYYGPLDCTCVIYNARDPGAYAPGRKEPLVLSAGRLWDEAKNVAALRAVAPRLPWRVVVAGEADGQQDAWVQRLGPLGANQLAGWMSRAAIYCLPARYEPFGLSVLEAALSGCALVLGDIDSLREIWHDAAVFVPPDDHEELTQVIERLIERPDERAVLGERARRRAMQFSPPRMARSYLGTYRTLLRRVPMFEENVACIS